MEQLLARYKVREIISEKEYDFNYDWERVQETRETFVGIFEPHQLAAKICPCGCGQDITVVNTTCLEGRKWYEIRI